MLDEYIGLEGAWVDLGEVSATSGADSFSGETAGFTIQGIARVPVTKNLALFGKAGAFIWDAEGSATISGSTSSFDDDGVDVVYGLGASYRLNEHLGLRGEWEEYSGESGEDYNLFSLGAEYRF